MSDDFREPPAPGYPPPPAQYPPVGDPVYQSAGYPPVYPYAPTPPPYSSYPLPSAYGRPGTTTAAAVLGFVVAGLLFLAGVILFSGASMVNDLGNDLNADTSSVTTELVFDGLVNLGLGALLITAGVGLISGRQSGRTMLFVGVALVVCDGVYWLVRASDSSSALILWTGLFVVPAVVAAGLAMGASTAEWVSRRR